MAILSITLLDKTFETYAKYSPASPAKGIEAQLERFKTISPKERALVFSSEERGEIEKLYGMPIEKAADLIKWLKKLQEVQVGGLTLPLTEGQVKRLESNAKFFGTTPMVLLKQKVQGALFDALGG